MSRREHFPVSRHSVSPAPLPARRPLRTCFRTHPLQQLPQQISTPRPPQQPTLSCQAGLRFQALQQTAFRISQRQESSQAHPTLLSSGPLSPSRPSPRRGSQLSQGSSRLHHPPSSATSPRQAPVRSRTARSPARRARRPLHPVRASPSAARSLPDRNHRVGLASVPPGPRPASTSVLRQKSRATSPSPAEARSRYPPQAPSIRLA